MYLKRKIDAYLDVWKADPERKPLIVKGARQIGKTESIRRFSVGRYKSVIEINFALEPKYKTITEEGYDVESIVRHISLLDPSKEFLSGETVLVVDVLFGIFSHLGHCLDCLDRVFACGGFAREHDR